MLKKITITLEDYLYEFYKKVGENAGGLSVERVAADALFRLAGNLSSDVLQNKDNIRGN